MMDRLKEPHAGAMAKTIVFIATLDTKGPEARFLKDQIEKQGHSCLVVDDGVLGEPGFAPDVTREEVARAAGSSLAEVRALGDSGKAVEVMTAGLVKIVYDLHRTGKLDGVVSIGGGVGSAMATTAMRSLPIGVPKLMLVINGKIAQGGPAAWYIGSKDVTLMPAVCDIAGLNRVTRKMFATAAGGIVGMVEAEVEDTAEMPVVVLSQNGTTTAGGLKVKALLEDRGYEVVVFTGAIGTRSQGEFVESTPDVVGVIELGVLEIGNELFGGSVVADGARLEAAGKKGVFQLVTPGSVDFINFMGPETVPSRYRSRNLNVHNPQATLLRLNTEELKQVASTMAAKLNLATGPVKVVIPTRGFSSLDREGAQFYDPEADRAFVAELKSKLDASIPLREVEAHINDAMFAEAVVEEFLQSVGGPFPAQSVYPNVAPSVPADRSDNPDRLPVERSKIGEIEAYFKRYEEAPKEIVLKEDLLRLGVWFSDSALQRFDEGNYSWKSYRLFSWESIRLSDMNRQESIRVPEDFRLRGGPYGLLPTIVQVRMSPASPYVIDVLEDTLALTADGKTIAQVEYPLAPPYYSLRFDDGTRYGEVIPLIFFGHLAFVTGARVCQFAGEDACKFCDINDSASELKKSGRYAAPYKKLDQVAEVARVIMAEERTCPKPMVGFHITGGSILSKLGGLEEDDFYTRYAAAIKEKAGRDAWVLVQTMPKDEKTWREWERIGVDAVQPNQEVWGKDLFTAICPGKSRSVGGFDNYVRRLMDAVEVFGVGNVTSNFVAGVEMCQPYGFSDVREAVKHTLAGWDYLMAHGVIPRMTTWHVEVGSALHDNLKPPLDYFIQIDMGWYELWRKHKLPPPAGWGPMGTGLSYVAHSAFMEASRYHR